MGVRHPTSFSRRRKQKRTRLSRSARRNKSSRRNKVLKNERKEIKLIIQQAKRNGILLNDHLKKGSEELLPTPPEKFSTTLEKKKERNTPVMGILAWIGRIFLRR